MNPYEWQTSWAEQVSQEIEADTVMESCETDFNGAQLAANNTAREIRAGRMNAPQQTAGNLMNTVRPIYVKAQRAGLVIHVVAESFVDLSASLPWLRDGGDLFSPKFSGGLHPAELPLKSRDFH